MALSSQDKALIGAGLLLAVASAATFGWFGYRHARTHVVTASMDHIDFIAPVHVGDLLILKSSVNRAFNTSMEVGVKVWVQLITALSVRYL